MLSLFASWLLATSVMPVLVGAAVGAVSPRLLRPCAASWRRQALRAALASWLAHLALVGSAVLVEGAMADYGAVLLAAVAMCTIGCWAGRGRRPGLRR